MADKALLLGINNYATVSDLRGCINDVRNMRDTLMSVFRFAPDSIKTLTDQEVVKSQVQRQMDWLMEARPGDRVLFHYSGHGSFIDDRDGDETSDGRDELICLHDMAWERPDTFFTDDELRAWTKRLPTGVQLLVVMDCCHSGTNTRFLADARSISDPRKVPLVDASRTQDRSLQGMRGASSAFEDEQHTVRVRYAPPPAWVVAAAERKRGARAVRGQQPIDPAMNHILLAGCRDDQTSADAYIGSDFQGAFTHHLCQALKQGGASVDRGDLMRQVKTALSRDQFEQVPQLEGPRGDGPLFGASATSAPAPSSAPSFPPSSGTAGSASWADKLKSQVAALAQQLHDLQQQLHNLPSTVAGTFAGRGGDKHLVYVHGICWHDAGYSNSWWEALKPYAPSIGNGQLGGTRHEVLWSDLVSSSPRAGVRAATPLPEEARQFRNDLVAVLEDRLQREAQTQAATRGTRDPSPIAMPRAMFGVPGLDCIDDFMKYLYFDNTRMQVIDRVRQVVAPLLRAGADVAIISHSWGTVVAYEALRMMENEGLGGRVPAFFTVGSALATGLIRQRLLPPHRNGAKPGHVNTWVNLDAQGDPVGGALAHWAALDAEFLELSPVGCTPNWLGSVSPACAHSSYFNAANLQTNRDIFGRYLEA